jgi:hypothetical protein
MKLGMDLPQIAVHFKNIYEYTIISVSMKQIYNMFVKTLWLYVLQFWRTVTTSESLVKTQPQAYTGTINWRYVHVPRPILVTVNCSNFFHNFLNTVPTDHIENVQRPETKDYFWQYWQNECVQQYLQSSPQVNYLTHFLPKELNTSHSNTAMSIYRNLHLFTY